MVSTVKIKEHNFSDSDKFLIDTNILIYLFSPFNSDDFGYDYFFEEACINGSSMYVCETSISEFINRNCRIAYSQYLKNNGLKRREFEYKRHYRGTQDFKDNYEHSLELIREDICPLMDILTSRENDIEKAMSEDYQLLDFNDEIIYQVASRNGYNIVTHDKDFLNLDSSISIYRSH